MKSFRAILAIVLVLLSGVLVAQIAHPPELFNYQGRISDAVGQPIDGQVDLQFTFYPAESGGPALLYVLQPNVPVTRGLYKVLIGSGAVTPGSEISLANMFRNHSEVWLGVKVNEEAETTPRARIASVPYALASESARNVDLGPIARFMNEPDYDWDGFEKAMYYGDDCDDSNLFIYRGAPELCDGVDNQCPGDIGYGQVDEGCGICEDLDADGRGLGCAAGPDCDDLDMNNWNSCETCTDYDYDGWFAQCDDYVTIDGTDCNEFDPNNWVSCATCADLDGDEYFSGCDDYFTIFGPDCNISDPNHWQDCGLCTDYDADDYGFLCDLGNDCDEEDPLVHEGCVYSAVIGPGGGTITVVDSGSPINGVILEIPAGALGSTVEISISVPTESPYFPLSGYAPTPVVMDLEPSGTTFAKPVILTIPYSGTLDEDEYAIIAAVYDEENMEWSLASLLGIDPANDTLKVGLNHFSTVSDVTKKISDILSSPVTTKPAFEFDNDRFSIQNPTPPEYPTGVCWGIASYTKWYFATKRDCVKLAANYPNYYVALDVATEAHGVNRNSIFIPLLELVLSSQTLLKDSLTASFLVTAMLLTGNPQVMGLVWENAWNDGHAILVYAWDGQKFSVYDSNLIDGSRNLGLQKFFVPYQEISKYRLYVYIDTPVFMLNSGMNSIYEEYKDQDACWTCSDQDGDHFFTDCANYNVNKGPDCNDTNCAVYPEAPEIKDGIDNQCPMDPASVDEGCNTPFFTGHWKGYWTDQANVMHPLVYHFDSSTVNFGDIILPLDIVIGENQGVTHQNKPRCLGYPQDEYFHGAFFQAGYNIVIPMPPLTPIFSGIVLLHTYVNCSSVRGYYVRLSLPPSLWPFLPPGAPTFDGIPASGDIYLTR